MQTQKQRTKRLKIKAKNQKVPYTTENTERNNRKDSSGKNGINNRVQNVGEIIEDKIPVEMMQWLIKHQITNNKKKQQVMDKEKKKQKNSNIVIVMVNSKAKTTRSINLEVLVQEQKLKLKRGGKKTI